MGTKIRCGSKDRMWPAGPTPNSLACWRVLVLALGATSRHSTSSNGGDRPAARRTCSLDFGRADIYETICAGRAVLVRPRDPLLLAVRATARALRARLDRRRACAVRRCARCRLPPWTRTGSWPRRRRRETASKRRPRTQRRNRDRASSVPLRALWVQLGQYPGGTGAKSRSTSGDAQHTARA